jgi:hypothetical protein
MMEGSALLRPSGQVLSLIGALSNPTNHALHVQAIQARDHALSVSVDSYNHLCLQLLCVLIGADQPDKMLAQIDPNELVTWQRTDPESVRRLQENPTLWVPFGQMAGLMVKNALLWPPGPDFCLRGEPAAQARRLLLLSLSLSRVELRNVASTIVATCAVAPTFAVAAQSDEGASTSVQPALHLRSWTDLIPALVAMGSPGNSTHATASVEGSLVTIRKIMEDGPAVLDQEELDLTVTALLEYLSPAHPDRYKLAALQGLAALLSREMMPSALVLHFDRYLAGLSSLAADGAPAEVAAEGPNTSSSPATATNSPAVRQWVCRNIVTLLGSRPEFVRPHFRSIATFMLAATSRFAAEPDVALEACEFWLTLAHLEEDAMSADMSDAMIQTILPTLVPALVHCMVYPPEKQEEFVSQYELELSQPQQLESLKPVFHRSKALKSAHRNQSSSSGHQVRSEGEGVDAEDDSDGGDGDENDDSDEEEDDDDSNEWTLRKCAAASLDSLAIVYGTEPVLPHLLPVLEAGLKSDNPWYQEASILALGAVAEGCGIDLSSSLATLHPLLLHIFSTNSAGPNVNALTIPQLQCISAWTLGRYAHWAVEQVQTGAQGRLLAHMTHVFMARLGTVHRRVHVACCAAFGVLVEAAGDLMAPYLKPIYQTLVSALSRYQGRSMLLLFDVLGIMADSCGPAIAEGDLPSIYVPPLLQKWDEVARRDPTDRTLLPLMESLASIALTSAANYQPFALETYEKAMATIEQVKLAVVTANGATDAQQCCEEDVDPIICATDLIDALVEGLGLNFQTLVGCSSRYGSSMFLTVLHSLMSSKSNSFLLTAGVQMSALALFGDLARNCPAMLEPVVSELLSEAIQCMDPTYGASVCTNAVWAVGEICVQCQRPPGQQPSSSTFLDPLAPSLMHSLVALLMGNGTGRGSHNVSIPGLAENAAACAGRLALVSPAYVAPELPRFLLGWCEGLAKIRDPRERHDGYAGFVAALYMNPQAISHLTCAHGSNEAMVSILYAVMTWHIPENCLDGGGDQLPHDLLHGPNYSFRPFPPNESELGASLVRLVQEMRASVSAETWGVVESGLPVNVRRLLRHSYNV